eukprot:4332549-Prymnesium_polylepis.1
MAIVQLYWRPPIVSANIIEIAALRFAVAAPLRSILPFFEIRSSGDLLLAAEFRRHWQTHGHAGSLRE